MDKMHSQDYRLVLRQGLEANLNTTATKNSSQKGELVYTTDTKALHIFDGTNYQLPSVTAPVPASASATGIKGQIAVDSDYLYVCTATDTWKRVGIATW